jgi:serine/threonine protein kinase
MTAHPKHGTEFDSPHRPSREAELERPVPAIPVDTSIDAWIGRRIGAYRLSLRIGQGGMGTVYKAVRDDAQYEKTVAVKLVRSGFDTKSVLDRFRQERRILARLVHPCIATLLDGGSTEEGVPYLVMEYVEGLPITAYCQANKLPIAEKLRLFLFVCSAVEYAHQNLVIHRDLKPGNILISRDAVPKLLDFGIARLLDAESPSQLTSPTLGTRQMLTPDYASPEQVRGETIKTTTDIYSLGAVLYELLTGQRPHQLSGRSAAEIERAICQQEIRRPSVVASERASGRLRWQLSGDLDNIVLMAMRTEPERRYQSVGQFAEDIRNYLEQNPVSARSDTLRYRSGKFLFRHKLGAAATALVVLSLAAGIVATTRQTRRAERRFQQVHTLATDFLFNVQPEIQALPGSTEIQEMALRTALDYLDSLASETRRSPQLLQDLAKAYEKAGDVQGNPQVPNLGQTVAALNSYRKALAIERQLLATRPGDRLIQQSIAQVHYKTSLLELRTRNSSAALESVRQGLDAIENLQTLHPADSEIHRLRGMGYSRMGEIEENRGNQSAALASFQTAVAIHRQWVSLHAEERAQQFLAASLSDVGSSLADQGQFQDAFASCGEALSIREALVRRRPGNAAYRRELMLALRSLGDISGGPYRLTIGDMVGAARYYRRALALAEALAEGDARNAQANTDLSLCLRKLGNVVRNTSPEEAIGLYRRSQVLTSALLEGAAGNTDFRRYHALNSMGLAAPLTTLKRYDEALHSLQSARLELEELSMQDPRKLIFAQDVQSNLMQTGDLLMEQRNLPAAMESYLKAQSIAESVLAANTSNSYSRRDLADVHERLGHYHSRVAVESHGTEERRANWIKAKDCYMRAMNFWNSWSEEKPNPYVTSRREQTAALIQKCEARLASLAPRKL